MSRRCSHCGNLGHNSRTCVTSTTQMQMQLNGSERGCASGVDDEFHSSSPFSVPEFVRKTMSLSSSPSSVACSSSESSRLASGYEFAFEMEKMIMENNQGRRHQDCNIHLQSNKVPWSEEEHQRFLEGVEKLGKGNWRGISNEFVTTRTRLQVASHAQNYFRKLQPENHHQYDHPEEPKP